MQRSLSLAFAIALLAAPAAARADAAPPAEPAGVAAVQPSLATPAPPAPEMKLKEVRVEEAQQDRDADVATPQRGSFWWLVGVIVVAGVILAVLL